MIACCPTHCQSPRESGTSSRLIDPPIPCPACSPCQRQLAQASAPAVPEVPDVSARTTCAGRMPGGEPTGLADDQAREADSSQGGRSMTTSLNVSHEELQEVIPGLHLMAALAALPPHTLISEHQLAQMFGRHVSSIRRAMQRGELPPTVPLLNDHVWTAEVLWAHMSARLEAAGKAAAQMVRRLQDFRPGQGGHH